MPAKKTSPKKKDDDSDISDISDVDSVKEKKEKKITKADVYHKNSESRIIEQAKKMFDSEKVPSIFVLKVCTLLLLFFFFFSSFLNPNRVILKIN